MEGEGSGESSRVDEDPFEKQMNLVHVDVQGTNHYWEIIGFLGTEHHYWVGGVTREQRGDEGAKNSTVLNSYVTKKRFTIRFWKRGANPNRYLACSLYKKGHLVYLLSPCLLTIPKFLVPQKNCLKISSQRSVK
jgi:hypothetical protein